MQIHSNSSKSRVLIIQIPFGCSNKMNNISQLNDNTLPFIILILFTHNIHFQSNNGLFKDIFGCIQIQFQLKNDGKYYWQILNNSTILGKSKLKVENNLSITVLIFKAFQEFVLFSTFILIHKQRTNHNKSCNVSLKR